MDKESILKRCILIFVVLLIGLLCACGAARETVTIGFAACEKETSRSIALIKDVMKTVNDEGYSIELRCAEGNLSNQKENIQELLLLDIKYLLVIPTKTIGLEDILKSATERGVNVVILDRNMESSVYTDYMAQISADAYTEGSLCAQALAAYYAGEEAGVLEIQGQAGSSLTNDRMRGFRDKLCEYDNLEIEKVIDGEFDRIQAERSVREYVDEGGRFNAVFGHSDEEGLGMLASMDNQNLNNLLPIVSIGGQQEIKQALIADNYLATVVSTPFLGKMVLEVIQNNESGKAVDKTVTVPSYLYTKENAGRMQEY